VVVVVVVPVVAAIETVISKPEKRYAAENARKKSLINSTPIN